MNSTQLNNIPKACVNLRDKLKGGTNQKKDYQLDYRVNQKWRMIKRLELLLEKAKELPTEIYEYSYYSLNSKLENYEDKMSDLLEKADKRGHEDETGKMEKELRNIEILKKKDKNLNDYYMIIDKEQIEKMLTFASQEQLRKDTRN
ncbi:hypothetical protein C2G38_2173996 [Gigaspora rosea]|uniref:Uncharacterized protein n=1 Tax=Gigaspora rosea TaxID=44941 RepID=A0A397VKA7_9GLOM|nr:hypothetical protein C2G38_2173996 [Gigaspora rosea]